MPLLVVSPSWKDSLGIELSSERSLSLAVFLRWSKSITPVIYPYPIFLLFLFFLSLGRKKTSGRKAEEIRLALPL